MREPADRSAPHPAAAVPSVADRDLVLTVRSVTGQWGPLQFSGPGQLRLTSDAMVLDAPRGASLRAKFAAITGAAWRTGALVVHGVDGRVVMETEAGLETAWVALVSRACPLPEFTRGYRRLGSRRGGTPETQARFLGPLLQARRQLEEEADLDRRVAALEAKALRARLQEAIVTVAQEAFPDSSPDRRALSVELQEALALVFARIAGMDEAATRYRASDEATRFVAWREWVDAVGSVFRDADRVWASVAVVLPARSTR